MVPGCKAGKDGRSYASTAAPSDGFNGARL